MIELMFEMTKGHFNHRDGAVCPVLLELSSNFQGQSLKSWVIAETNTKIESIEDAVAEMNRQKETNL